MEKKVVKPVGGCSVCLEQFTLLKDLWGMHKRSPGDPGAIGAYEAAEEGYHGHHRLVHGTDVSVADLVSIEPRQVLAPVSGCDYCGKRLALLRLMANMAKSVPHDDVAQKILQDAIDEYHEHHRVTHGAKKSSYEVMEQGKTK